MPTETFLTIGPFCWGRGDTPEASLKKCRSIFGPGLKEYDTYRVHPETTVDDMGSFSYPSGPGGFGDLANKPVLVKRVRKGKEIPLCS
jgi:hypothetical protein